MPDWSFLALYLWLAMMMMVGLDFLYFLVIWIVNNSVKLVLPLIHIEGCQFICILSAIFLLWAKLNNSDFSTYTWTAVILHCTTVVTL